MFTIPLPLVLNSFAVGQENSVDSEPILIATRTTVEPARIDVANFNFYPPVFEGRVDHGARSFSGNRLDPLRLIHPTARPASVAPMKIGVTHANHIESDVNKTPEHIVSGRHAHIVVAKSPRWVADRYAVTRIRSEKFVSFDSQAPPRNAPAIACACASKYFIPISSSEFLCGAQSPSEPSVSISNPIHRNYRIAFEHSIFIPPNDSRRPHRYLIRPLVLT